MTPTAYVDGCVCCCTLQVWASFHPGGSELPPQKKTQLARGLLQHVDKNHDGSMDFEEFAGWPVCLSFCVCVGPLPHRVGAEREKGCLVGVLLCVGVHLNASVA